MILIHSLGSLYYFSLNPSIILNQVPSCFMHKYQIPKAMAIAKRSRPAVLKKFLTGVSTRTESVFLPETFSTK